MNYIVDELELKAREKGITVFYFYADWLLFHKKMQIMIEKAEEKYSEIEFRAVDIDSFKNIVQRFKIESIPTFVIMKDGGVEIKRLSGMMLTSAFMKAFGDIEKGYKEKNHDKEK